jgi:hypothetical protein
MLLEAREIDQKFHLVVELFILIVTTFKRVDLSSLETILVQNTRTVSVATMMEKVLKEYHEYLSMIDELRSFKTSNVHIIKQS